MRHSVTIALAAAVILGGTVASADPGERVSTLADQRAVGITIYNSDLALVRDRRHLDLPDGESHLALRDVSARIQPETALLTSVGAPQRITVLEQNFDYDLLSPEKLLEKYVGRDVDVIHSYDPRTGEKHSERARVLATNGGIVLRYADRIETSVNGQLSFPSLPPDLRDRPTLISDLLNSGAGAQDIELTYLTSGLSWHADYTALLDANDDRLDLRGLITLQNQSGTTFPNAAVQLVAGDVNVVRPQIQTIGMVTSRSSQGLAQSVQEQGLLEYHLYTLGRKTTIADNQTKQVALLSAAAVPVIKTLELDGSDYYYRNPPTRGDLGAHLKVGTFVSFKNSGGDLGIPLPAGTIRVYKRDSSGTAQFVGSDSIDHTPKNETVRLLLGNSFDVTASKKQTDFHIVDGNTFESAYEIIVRNAHKNPETVLVVEPIPADWTMLQTSIPFQKTSSSTASWNVRVPAEGSTTLTYRVRVVY
jgi:hypothetical protein